MRSPAFTVALLIALAIVTLWWQLAEKRARKADAELARVPARIEALADSLGRGQGRGPGSASDEEIDRLRHETVLANPLHALRAELARHPELIPSPGVQGGTMFFDTASVVLLPGGFAHASFEDGHVGGYAILEYRVSRGRVAWKRIAAARD